MESFKFCIFNKLAKMLKKQILTIIVYPFKSLIINLS